MGFFGPLLGAIAGAISSHSSAQKAHSRSVSNMQMQHQMDMDMWRHQNAYNTPKAQMQRLRNAGLNPALMYGQGTTGNASNYPQTKFTQLSPYMSAGDIGGLANASIQMALSQAQKDNIESDTNVKKTVAARNRVLTRKDRAEIRKINRSIVNMDASTAKMLQEETNLKTLNDYQRLQNELQEKVVERANKGIIRGDTIGNILEMFGLDPVNNKDHRNWLYGALGAWYGSTVAKNIMTGVGSLIPSKKTFDIFNDYKHSQFNK